MIHPPFLSSPMVERVAGVGATHDFPSAAWSCLASSGSGSRCGVMLYRLDSWLYLTSEAE